MISSLPSPEVYKKYENDPQLRGFLQTVFQQVDVDRFMQIFSEVVSKPNQTSEQIYQSLLTRAPEAKGGVFSKVRKGFRALKEEKATLAENVAKIVDPERTKEGYVEIGTGRMIRPLKRLMGLKGRITAVNDQESLIQVGLLRPYDRFNTLTYDPLALQEKSVDVISCFIGLHHCPPEKLQAFIQSIHNTLRDGGILLLRDHDAKDKKMQELVQVVHSVFNAASGVSLEEEKQEIRQFQGVNTWKKVLENNGFRCVSEPLVREGDTTENALLKFVKTGSIDDDLNSLRERMINNKNNYTRPREQTHFTASEWFNVESSQNLKNYPDFWDYPYFRDVKTLFQNFGKSWHAARKVKSLKGLVTSAYMGVNSVIITCMSVEYIAKGILYAPLWALSKASRLLPKKTSDAAWEKPSQQYSVWMKKYGEDLEKSPFYAHTYLPSIQKYWKTFHEAWKQARTHRSATDLTFDRQTVKNIATGLVMSVDLTARALISVLFNAALGGEEKGDDREIGIIVKGPLPNLQGDKLQIITEENNQYTGIISPRYKELASLLKTLTDKGIEIVEIAGHTEMQIDVVIDKEDNTLFAQEKLHERPYLPDAKKKIVVLQVPVKELKTYFTHHVHRIYDF